MIEWLLGYLVVGFFGVIVDYIYYKRWKESIDGEFLYSRFLFILWWFVGFVAYLYIRFISHRNVSDFK